MIKNRAAHCQSKYPPAKPGALNDESLKPAKGAANAAPKFGDKFMLSHMMIDYPTRSRLNLAYTCFVHHFWGITTEYAHSRPQFAYESIFRLPSQPLLPARDCP